jgi:hypothetical protein
MTDTKTLAPAKTLTRRKKSVRGLWNVKKRSVFLAELAMTANVSASARAAKMKEAQAYQERRKSSEFRAAWAAALSEGYARLEMMMLERAMRALSPSTAEKDADPAQSKMDEYSNKLALTLLAAHRASVRDERGGAGPASRVGPDLVGARDRLARKLDIMHARLTGKSGDA